MIEKVYAETSIIGAYFEERIDMELQTHRQFKQIRLCNNSLGLYVPNLVTPNQLIGNYYD